MSKKDKLISVDHLKWNVGGIKCGKLTVDYLNWILDHEEPAVDAVPVRHGKWIATEEYHGFDDEVRNKALSCSVCRVAFRISDYAQIEDFRYCPNCGARMHEE